jgi:hypothetical protein
MTFIFTIRISRCFSSARDFQMGNFQKYWSQNVGQDFIVLDFFPGRKILKVDGRDGWDPQNREKNAPAGRFTWIIMYYFILNTIWWKISFLFARPWARNLDLPHSRRARSLTITISIRFLTMSGWSNISS